MHNYLFKLQFVMVRGAVLVDDTLALIAIKRKIMVEDLQESFSLNSLTTSKVLEFLIRFGFAKLEGQYVVLSESSESFFLETTSR